MITTNISFSNHAVGSFRVNSTKFDNFSPVTVSNITKIIPKITLVSIVKACQMLGCNSEYLWRYMYSLSKCLFYMACLSSRLKWLHLKYHIYTLYTDSCLKLAIMTKWDTLFCSQIVSTCNHLLVMSSRKWINVHLCKTSGAYQGDFDLVIYTTIGALSATICPQNLPGFWHCVPIWIQIMA